MRKAFKKSYLLCFILCLFAIACKKTTTTTTINVTEAKELITNNPSIPIIDVRTPKEFSAGHIDQAINIDVKANDFKNQVKSKLDSTQTYLVYCKSGKRSTKAVKIMEELGFDQLYNMQGGFIAWSKSQKE